MTRAEQVWYRLEVLTPSTDDTLSQLWDAGALGIEVQDRDTYMEDGSIPPVPDGLARLIAFFDDPYDETELDDAVEVVSNARYDDRSWETAWKAYFRPVAVSPRAVVGPPWEEFDAPPGGIRIEIEPGMAFGTGTHETTQLSATLLDEIVAGHDPTDLLDVGCGTGVLSMIAAGLGVPRVVGVDVDETAVEIARENLRRNGMTGRVDFSTTRLDRLGLFDLVVANILAHILLELRDDLVRRVRPGGFLLVSGVTTSQADDFVDEFGEADATFDFVSRTDRGDWSALLWRRCETE